MVIRPPKIAWRPPILSWPRIMFSKFLCYNFSTVKINALDKVFWVIWLTNILFWVITCHVLHVLQTYSMFSQPRCLDSTIYGALAIMFRVIIFMIVFINITNIAIVVIMVSKLIIVNADIIGIIFSKNFSWVSFPTILSCRDALNIAPNKRHQRTLMKMPTRDTNTKVHFSTTGALEIIVYY